MLAALIEALTAAIADDIEESCNWRESTRVDAMVVEVNKLVELNLLEVAVIDDPIKALLEVPLIDPLMVLLEVPVIATLIVLL